MHKQELNGFLKPDFREQMVVDRSPAVSFAVFLVLLSAARSRTLRARSPPRSPPPHPPTTSTHKHQNLKGELLRVNFNVSFPALSCEFLTLDVSDALGTKRLNITKTVRKLPLKADGGRAGFYVHDDLANAPVVYDESPPSPPPADEYDKPIDAAHFQTLVDKYPVVVVNFYAPWCPWCQRLEPTWDAVSAEVRARYPEADGRLRFAKVDCTVEVDLCRGHQITGFPSLRVFRKVREKRIRRMEREWLVFLPSSSFKHSTDALRPPPSPPTKPSPTHTQQGHDEVNVHGVKDHEAYRGERTKDALLTFADNLATSAGAPHEYVRGVTRMAASPGCGLSGFVLVKKVPGTLHMLAKSPGHSFDHAAMNLSHTVHAFTFGNAPSPRRAKALAAMHPRGLTSDWADKLAGQSFASHNGAATFEHYAQVVLTTVEPRGRGAAAGRFDAYEYVAHSHTYNTASSPGMAGPSPPSAKFSYDMSPIQIVVSETPRAWYRFVTSMCAVVGGVFTVAGIVDGLIHSGRRALKKVELGKQG